MFFEHTSDRTPPPARYTPRLQLLEGRDLLTSLSALLVTSGTVQPGGAAVVQFSNLQNNTGQTARYSYDFTNDGVFDVRNTTRPSFVVPATLLTKPTTFQIRGRVTAGTEAREYTAWLTVTNVAFSADEKTVKVSTGGKQYDLARPVVSPWRYAAAGRTLWVDPAGNNQAAGTNTAPFATIARAVEAARPGDVVYVRAGTYREAISLTRSGTADKPIVVSCAPGDLGKVKVTPSANWVRANPRGAVVTFRSVSHVWVNGLVIEGPKGRPEALASEDFGANGVTFANGAGAGCRVTNCVVSNNLHCGIKEMGHGGTGILVEGNVIYGNGVTLLDHGIYMPANDVVMNGNVVFSNAGFGIHSYAAPQRQVITRNVAFNHPGAGIIIAGSDNVVRYNTCFGNTYGILYFRGGCVGNVVERNIFASNRWNGACDNGGGRMPGPTNNRDDSNVYFGSAPDAQSGQGTNTITNVYRFDPLFLAAARGDFRTAAGSPAAGLGAFAR